ncbi:hypothetical protein [Saccharothrix sp.]|uniref:hypothetical protein n=1 Tax=Saccharothrix sp. TaxID=1873460 RepID=UPI0028114374|nr:hypothetical protein [Saccharothrix sp.]
MPTIASVREITPVPEIISELTTLVQAGDIPAARKLGKKLLNVADARDLWLIRQIADVLENRPQTAASILRRWSETAPTDADRAIIAACTPAPGEQRHRPQPEADRPPRWNSHNKYQAPSTVHTRQRGDVRRQRRTRQQQINAAVLANYQAERAGVAEGDQILDRDERARAEQPYASGFDYDRAALYDTDVPFRCLACTINRGSYDLDRARIDAGHGDDGLCADCRESGCPSIPELNVGHSLTDAVTARCAFILAAFGPVAARVFLRAEWRLITTPVVRAAIADFASANLPPEEPAETPATPTPCATCAGDRTLRDVRGLAADDGLCRTCRADTTASGEGPASRKSAKRRARDARAARRRDRRAAKQRGWVE